MRLHEVPPQCRAATPNQLSPLSCQGTSHTLFGQKCSAVHAALLQPLLAPHLRVWHAPRAGHQAGGVLPPHRVAALDRQHSLDVKVGGVRAALSAWVADVAADVESLSNL